MRIEAEKKLFTSEDIEKMYEAGILGPDDRVELLDVEISDTTLDRDLKKKLPHYAASGVPEFWIEDLQHGLIHVFREPEGSRYKVHLKMNRGESISPLAFPDVALKVTDLLG